MPIDSSLAAIFGSILLAVLVFWLNGWRERSFERRKVNYSTKLGTFLAVNKVIEGIDCTISGIDELASMNLRSENSIDIFRVVGMVERTRSLGLPEDLRIESIVVERARSLLLKSDDKASREDAGQLLHVYVVPAYLDAFNHYLTRLSQLEADMLLVSDTPEVERSVRELGEVMRNCLEG